MLTRPKTSNMHIQCYCSILCSIYHQSVLSKGRSFTANSGTKAAVLPKGRSSTANSGTKVAVNRCGRFPLLSAPHSLFSFWTGLKRSETIPGAPTWRWGEWIWLIGLSGLHRYSPQGLNISSIRIFDQIRDREIPITLCPHALHKLFKLKNDKHNNNNPHNKK